EVDQEAFEKSLKEDRFLREKDLRNHLTATIETPEEEKMRLNLEKEERARRIKEMEEKKKAAKKDKEDIFRAINPKEDYQVLQAVRYIEGAAAFARTKNNK